jgi:uncharacterized RDD family membrane protein YckC
MRLLGVPRPRTGPEIARTILWNFSLPVWLYFLLSDRSPSGATLGKRVLKIQVREVSGGQVSTGRALVRTAVKLLPWELVHVSAFALSTDLRTFRPVQAAGIATTNVLTAAYLGLAVVSKGRRSADDYAAGTLVRFVAPSSVAARLASLAGALQAALH